MYSLVDSCCRRNKRKLACVTLCSWQFFCDFGFWFVFMRTRGGQTKKTMGERAREGEREKENLRLLLLLPPPTFSGLTSVQLSRGCISYGTLRTTKNRRLRKLRLWH